MYHLISFITNRRVDSKIYILLKQVTILTILFLCVCVCVHVKIGKPNMYQWIDMPHFRTEKVLSWCWDAHTWTYKWIMNYLSYVFIELSLSLTLSLSLSLSPHLCHLFSVSLRLSLHACFSAALLFICGKTKKEKMLSFLFVFVFFLFSEFLFSCISSAMKPFTHAPSVSLHHSPLFLTHIMNIMIVLPRLMIILRCEGHCSNNPRCSHSRCVRFKWTILGPRSSSMTRKRTQIVL